MRCWILSFCLVAAWIEESWYIRFMNPFSSITNYTYSCELFTLSFRMTNALRGLFWCLEIELLLLIFPQQRSVSSVFSPLISKVPMRDCRECVFSRRGMRSCWGVSERWRGNSFKRDSLSDLHYYNKLILYRAYNQEKESIVKLELDSSRL